MLTCTFSNILEKYCTKAKFEKSKLTTPPKIFELKMKVQLHA